jgi:hypothetical protein
MLARQGHDDNEDNRPILLGIAMHWYQDVDKQPSAIVETNHHYRIPSGWMMWMKMHFSSLVDFSHCAVKELGSHRIVLGEFFSLIKNLIGQGYEGKKRSWSMAGRWSQ